MITIENKDALLFLKEQKDNSADMIFCDPPYALGSEITINSKGKVDYKKASDFMNKWDMPNGAFWEEFYIEAMRVLKHGGHCLMFGMDRQLLLFKYYAHLAGFTEKQSLYWFFISNFPKATDLSKMIDKNAGAEREVVGKNQYSSRRPNGNDWAEIKLEDTGDITAPSTPLAKKYSGYKYSIAPLKQTNETIMVFQKPYKTGSCLHDTLAYENGDESITCGGLDIDGNRVGTEQVASGGGMLGKNGMYGEMERDNNTAGMSSGRYPSQTFCDSGTAEVLDGQSGVSKSTGHFNSKVNMVGKTLYEGGYKDFEQQDRKLTDIGGCSKILHKCDFENDEHDLYFYQPKVSKSERNAGCENVVSNHPTLKPISLIERVLKLFKTPNEQTILIPFAGSGSEMIGAYKAGFENIIGCELNPEYVQIAEARIKHWCK